MEAKVEKNKNIICNVISLENINRATIVGRQE
jgi:hypothetical protein